MSTYPGLPPKPYQEQLQMIREGLVAALADGVQGPLLATALQSRLGLPYKRVDVSGTTLDLSDTHNGAIVELLAADTVVTLRPQASYAWPTDVFITLRSEHVFSVVSGAGVEVNGETAETWTCDAWPKAITLHRRAENSWGLTGAAAVAP